MIRGASRICTWLIAGLLLVFLPACALLTATSTLQTPTVSQTGEYKSPATAIPSPTETQAAPVKPDSSQTTEPGSTSTDIPEPTATPSPEVIFAAIGDFGTGNRNEANVAKLVLSWKPEFIITLGDDNYPDGSASHIDEAIGQFYHSYIYPYIGSYGEGADVNRFFPSLGNHDLMSEDGQPYYDYFQLPGNERYYDFTWEMVHLFALDNIESEPDGVGVSSKQAEWLKQELAASTSTWNIVYMHYPPYSSGRHGSTDWARWPYAEWGADAVLSAHDHTYERLDIDGFPYFVNGLGGAGIYNFDQILDGSMIRYNNNWGAIRVDATEGYILFEFITEAGEVVDRHEMRK